MSSHLSPLYLSHVKKRERPSEIMVTQSKSIGPWEDGRQHLEGDRKMELFLKPSSSQRSSRFTTVCYMHSDVMIRRQIPLEE